MYKYIDMNVIAKNIDPKQAQERDIVFSQPNPEDGAAVYELIQNCPPLDTNSMYCNLLQCTHFAHTSIKAEIEDELVGFVSGYVPPDKENTLFVWQVAVSDKARGKGLGKRMLFKLLKRASEQDVKFLETTITPDNEASWALFTSVAESMDTELNTKTLFDKNKHFNGDHDSEVLLRIGPFARQTVARTTNKVTSITSRKVG